MLNQLAPDSFAQPVGSRDRLGRGATPLGAPLAALFIGVPVWWILGLFQAAFFVASAFMGIYLLRRSEIKVPRGFGVWMLFLVWLLGGLFVLQVDAPGAVPGQSAARYLTYGYRFGWYLIGTIAALYVINTRRHLASERVCAAVAWFFVILIGGGLLGLMRPLNFPSALEIVLPNRLTRHQFVSDLIHPNTAQMHDFLGSAAPRPSAPFAYTNEWGMAVAVALPFFVLVWWRRQGLWRWATLVVVAIGLVPIIASLNRGLWVAISALVVFTAIRSALSGRFRLLAGLLALVLIAGVMILLSPLGALIQARLETPHSDEGRTNLSTQAVVSTLNGSPLIGFGSTRDVAGNFTSIAGGATHECPSCGPPPMGTHGQAWLLTFASGFGGLILFTAFMGGQFIRGLRSTSPTAPATVGSLLVLLVTMPFYNSIGVSLFICFLSVGLLARDDERASGRLLTLERLTGPVWRTIGVVVLLALLGGMAGALIHQVRGQPVRATQAVLVPTIDLVGVPDTRPLTLDSEALMVRSGPVLDAIGEATGNDDRGEISERILVGAEPNTRVLTVSYTDHDADLATAAVEVAVNTYLGERAALHANAYHLARSSLTAQHQTLSETVRGVEDAIAQRGPTLSRSSGRTLGGLRSQISTALAGIHALDPGTDVGHAVTGITIHHSTDAMLVRVGSGVTFGATAGLVVAWRLGDRVTRLSRHIRSGELDGLPVVLRTRSDAVGDTEAWRTIQRYRPLCGLLADPDSAGAVAFASRLGSMLPGLAHDSDQALLVVAARSRLGSVKKLRSRFQQAGVRPIGIVVVNNAKRSEGE